MECYQFSKDDLTTLFQAVFLLNLSTVVMGLFVYNAFGWGLSAWRSFVDKNDQKAEEPN